MAKEQKSESGKQGQGELIRSPGHWMSPFEEMERAFERYLPTGFLRPFRFEWPSWAEPGAPFEGRMPRADVIDRDEEVLVRAELPGVSKENLEVSITDGAVTIKGETRRESKEEEGNFFRSEMMHGSFSRTLSLPSEVNAERAQAKFKDGVLELKLPKVEKTKRRTVPVE